MTGINEVLNNIGAKAGQEHKDFVALWNSPEWKEKREAKKSQLDEKALEYLHVKFPEVSDEVFFTDSSGIIHEHIIDAESICDAAKIDYACINCKNGLCELPDKFRDRKGRPVAVILENSAEIKYLSVRRTCGIVCKHEPLSGEFGRMFKKSGLVKSQLTQTFESYERYGVNPEITVAKAQAMLAAREGSCLILAGKPGTGKTHLATAIAIEAMKHGKQAIFRLVSEMVDELRRANIDNSDSYHELMKEFKEVPCLVLDDLGKERTTAAGMDYVYQIVDHRHRHELQTILTTNARSPEELSLWGSVEYITPIVSRIMGRGAWVLIEHADDFRIKLRERELKAKTGKVSANAK